MDMTSNYAGSRMRERLFVMWQEAGGDPDAAYQLWHKVRPLLTETGTPASARKPDSGAAGKAMGPQAKRR